MNNENKTRMCNCKAVEKKIISLLNDNSNLLQMIRDLRNENERLKSGSNRLGSSAVGSRPAGTGTNTDNPGDMQSLIEINRGWKRDYEELQMRYEMLSGEKKLLEEEERELKERIGDLEKRQGPLQGEITRLATALYKRCQHDDGDCSPNDDQCEMLKAQIIVYKEDFERERCDRETIHEDREKLKQELVGAEEIIKRLTTNLDACNYVSSGEGLGTERISIRGEDGYLSERSHVMHPAVRHQHRMLHPLSPVMPESEYRRRLEQQRRGILPRNPTPTSFFYGGDVQVDRSCSSLPRA